jgi:hypothetical protein
MKNSSRSHCCLTLSASGFVLLWLNVRMQFISQLNELVGNALSDQQLSIPKILCRSIL